MRSSILLLTLLLAPAAAPAAVVAYEVFDYRAGLELSGLNGGGGWAGSWGTPGGLGVSTAATSLTFAGLASSGGAAAAPAASGNVAYYYRDLGTAIGADGQEFFFRFLLRPDAGFGFYGGLNLIGSTGNLFVGRSGSETVYGLETGASVKALSGAGVVAGETVLLVTRMRFQAGADLIDLYVNPTPGAPMPGSPDATLSSTDFGTLVFLALNNAGLYTTDEIAIGTDWESVTAADAAVPEPGSGLLAAAVLALAAVGARYTGTERRTV